MEIVVEPRAAEDELLRRGHDVEPTAAVAFASWSRMEWPDGAHVVVPLTGRMRQVHAATHPARMERTGELRAELLCELEEEAELEGDGARAP